MFPVNRLMLGFRNISTGQVFQIPQLSKDRPYLVVAARRVSGQYGPTVLLSVRSEEDTILLKVFLPRRYAEDFEDEDIYDINQGRKRYKLIYAGMSGPAYLLRLIL